jgi:hypothetical protein
MRSRPAKKTPMEMNKCATGLKTSLVALFALTAIISAAIARDAVQIPSGTYLQFPDVVTGNLSFDGSRVADGAIDVLTNLAGNEQGRNLG